MKIRPKIYISTYLEHRLVIQYCGQRNPKNDVIMESFKIVRLWVCKPGLFKLSWFKLSRYGHLKFSVIWNSLYLDSQFKLSRYGHMKFSVIWNSLYLDSQFKLSRYGHMKCSVIWNSLYLDSQFEMSRYGHMKCSVIWNSLYLDSQFKCPDMVIWNSV